MHILQLRGGLVETIHPVRAVAVHCDPTGLVRPLWAVGPEAASPWRSAAKPLQLWCSLEALGDPELPSEHIALGAASHAGQPGHLDALGRLLQRLAVEESGLRCGAEPPIHRGAWEQILREGGQARPLFNDCSGKHAFMLAASKKNGWDLDYRPADHPLQRRIHALVHRWTGAPPPLATDGCGVPTPWLSVDAMATAWARLAGAMAAAGDPWPDPRLGPDGSAVDTGAARAARIGWAMARHPWLTSGDGRLDLDVAAGAMEPLVGKIGAQGIFCLALPARRLGLAVKVLSGDEEALGVAVGALLEARAPGAWRRPDPWPWTVVRNVIGRTVGQRVAAGALGA